MQVACVVAGNCIQAEAVNVVIDEPILHNIFDLGSYVLTAEVQIGHTAPELSLIGVLRTADLVISTIGGNAEIVKIAVFATGLTVLTNVAACLGKPRMSVTAVVYHQIDNNANTALVCFVNQVFKVLKRAVIGIDRVIVGHVIFVIGGRGMNGHQPNTVKAHLFDVIELGGYTVEISNTVVVGIIKAVNENFVPVAVVIVNNVQRNLFLLFRFGLLFFAGKQRKRGKKNRKHKKDGKNFFHAFLLIP